MSSEYAGALCRDMLSETCAEALRGCVRIRFVSRRFATEPYSGNADWAELEKGFWAEALELLVPLLDSIWWMSRSCRTRRSLEKVQVQGRSRKSKVMLAFFQTSFRTNICTASLWYVFAHDA